MTHKKKNANDRGKANGSPPASACGAYFLSITLENVRCFGEKQTLDLSDCEGKPAQWTILFGNNGTGKTTVLQALALQLLLAASPDTAPENNPNTWTWWFVREAHSFFRRNGASVKLDAQFARGRGLHESRQHFEVVPFELEGPQNPNGCIASGHFLSPPIACYGYGAARRMVERSLPEGEPDTGTETLFSYHADLRNAEDWLLRADYAASRESPQRRRQQERLEQVKQLLLAILPEIDDIQLLTGSGVYPIPRVEFHTPYGWVPLRQLGYGYQTVLGWMVDFVSRMIERYPDSADPLAEPAVVLVDEIDLHLHPKWQRQLIGHLSQRFPNTQFIVTAHSPLVVQAATGANLALLRREGDHVVIDNEVTAMRNWRIDQVLTSELFDLPSARPPELDELLERRMAILTKSHLTKKDERALAALEEQIGPLPGGETLEQTKRLALIEESLKLLQQAPKP